MKTHEILSVVRQYNSLKERAIEIGDILAGVQGGLGPNQGNSINVDFDEMGANINWDQPCGRGCCSESFAIFVPIDYFEMDDQQIKENETQRIAAIKAEEERKKKVEAEAERVRKEKEKEERDRKEFERLKKKYENN
jgi:hypothetical protein